MKKKIISFVLSVILIFSISSFSLAASSVKGDIPRISLEVQIAPTVRDILVFIEPEKEGYGMEGVDFSTLTLGKQIPSYNFGKEGLTKTSNTAYFPIMSDGEWVATATVSQIDTSAPVVQVSTFYVEDYSKSATANDDIALVFDQSGAYIYSNNSFIESTRTIAEIDTSKPSIINNSKNLTLSFVSLSSEDTIDVGVSLSSVSRAAQSSTQKYLSVPTVKQATGSHQCWAASIASIRRYYGTPTTISQVYAFAGMNIALDEGVVIEKAEEVLNDYGFSTDYFHENSFSWDTLVLSITEDNPVFAGCEYGYTGEELIGHAVVLRGYMEYQNASGYGLVSYMDPIVGRHIASSVTSYRYFYYVPSDNSDSFRFYDFLRVYD